MSQSCCICGMVLATEDSDYPPWCKDIRAIYYLQDRPFLSDRGCMDNDPYPFLLKIPLHGLHRFHSQRSAKDNHQDLCYPFHSACWTIFLQCDHKNLVLQNIHVLFDLFDSVHSWNDTLRWGHSYYLEQMLDVQKAVQEDTTIKYRCNYSMLANPLYFQPAREVKANPLLTCKPWVERQSSCLDVLPIEIFSLVLYHLNFEDVQNLLIALRWSFQLRSLPTFWESRFWPTGEVGFASSILSSSYTRQEQFFIIISEMRQGLYVMNLRNRKRIWQLGSALINIIYTLTCPKWKLHGELPTASIDQLLQPVVSCLALKGNLEGCRELKKIYVPLPEHISGMALSYITIFNRRVISGLTFSVKDGRSVDIGYLSDSYRNAIVKKDETQFLWLVCSPYGLISISLEYPEDFLKMSPESNSEKLSVVRRSLRDIRGVHLGLDSMRIVRFSVLAPAQNTAANLLWTFPCPSLTIALHQDDIDSLFMLQKRSFMPASFHTIDENIESLIAIKVYSPLGHCAGITGIGFLYRDLRETTWGSADNAASLVFFLKETERVAKVEVFQLDSLTCHLQFTTTLGRRSEPIPQFSTEKVLRLRRVEFEAADGDFIRGFCGCFTAFSNQLHCFGCLAGIEITPSKSPWSSPPFKPVIKIGGTPISGIRNHGQHQTFLDFQKYRSIQPSVVVVETKHRRAGQVTGLLLYTNTGDIPCVFGQVTALGECYNLNDDEEILNLQFSMTLPISRGFLRPTLRQVQGLVVVTNQRRLKWGEVGGKDSENLDFSRGETVMWEFNAIFDRIIAV